MIAHPKAFERACKYIGLREVPGIEHNPEILHFFHEIGKKWVLTDETAWCAAFANAMLLRGGYKMTGELNARSFLDLGKSVLIPQVGDIVVFWRVNPHGLLGHVGFYMGERDGYVFCLGGNQSNSVNVAAYPKYQLLGYRRSFRVSPREVIANKTR